MVWSNSVQFKRFFIVNPHIKKTYNGQTFQERNKTYFDQLWVRAALEIWSKYTIQQPHSNAQLLNSFIANFLLPNFYSSIFLMYILCGSNFTIQILLFCRMSKPKPACMKQSKLKFYSWFLICIYFLSKQ